MSSRLRRFAKRFGPLAVAVKAVRAARTAKKDYLEEKRKEALMHARVAAIETYLRSHETPKLHVGVGPFPLPGWFNTDINPLSNEVFYLDASEEFPFADRTFDYVFSEHLIEHLTYEEGLYMLREIHRILKPLGRLRIATPDMNAIIGLFSPEKNSLQSRYLAWALEFADIPRKRPQDVTDYACFVINSFFYGWGHRFLYDATTLQGVLEEVGFVNITQFPPGESNDENLRGIESHGKSIGEEMNRFETTIMEATRKRA